MEKKVIIPIIVLIALIWGYIVITYAFYPAILFKNRIHNDNFTFYSNQEIPASIKILADSINRRIMCSEFYNENTSHNHKIALCQNDMLYSFLTVGRKAVGMTRPITNFVIVSPTDIDNNKLLRASSTGIHRSLSSLIVHEITHVLLNNHYGFYVCLLKPKWKIEGYCEYIAQSSTYDITKGTENFLNNLDDGLSYTYFKHRTYVTYLMDYKKMSFTEIMEQSIDTENLEQEIRTAIHSGLFKIDVQ